MEFLHRSKGDSLKFLSTNDRNIKLWKVVNRVQRDPSYCTFDDGMLRLPNAPVIGSGMEGKCRMEFKHCHLYNINSLSVSPDGENFISADDLRVNLCNLDNNKTAYNVVDLKPSNIESLSEVITSLEYHPQRSDMFLFSSSKGYISLCDMRISSQFERAHNRFQIQEDPSKKHFFTDIKNSISHAKFAPTSDKYIFSRDYMSVQIWDVRNTRSPVQTFNVTEYLD